MEWAIVSVCVAVLSIGLSCFSLGIRKGQTWEREDRTGRRE